MAWEKMSREAFVNRAIAEALFDRGVKLNDVCRLLQVKKHTVENWRDLYLYQDQRHESVLSLFDRPTLRAFIVVFLEAGYGYKAITKAFGLNLWFVRDTARSYRRGGLL